jgi:hypothetical protein
MRMISLGRVLGEDSSVPQSLQNNQSAPTAHISSNSDQRPLGMPALGGLFAGGMPTLKKSTGITTGRVDMSTELNDSRRESTDWFGRLASHPPTEENSSEGVPVTVPLIQDLSSTSSEAAVIPSPHDPLPQDSIHSKTSSTTNSQAEASAESKVDFDHGYRAKSLWAFTASAPDQLSFLADEYLRTFPSKEVENTDWMYGISEKNNSQKGWFPKTYIQQVEGNYCAPNMKSLVFDIKILTFYLSLQRVERFKARALFAYTSQNKGELSVERGDIVDILEKSDPQWWKAQTSTATGMLPATYMEEYVEGHPLPEGKKEGMVTTISMNIVVCIHLQNTHYMHIHLTE